jgi:hypothetical protein
MFEVYQPGSYPLYRNVGAPAFDLPAYSDVKVVSHAVTRTRRTPLIASPLLGSCAFWNLMVQEDAVYTSRRPEGTTKICLWSAPVDACITAS